MFSEHMLTTSTRMLKLQSTSPEERIEEKTFPQVNSYAFYSLMEMSQSLSDF